MNSFMLFILIIAALLVSLILLFVFYREKLYENRKQEKQIQERTAELNDSVKKLEEAYKQIINESHLKAVFLTNISHEIRTPLNSIIGFTELALDGEINENTKDYLKKIQTNSNSLLQIINDILDIAKIDSGKMELEKAPFDMHELLSECRAVIIPKAVEKGILLQFYAEPSVMERLVGDKTRLRQILVNLLFNAVKFTNSGIVKFFVSIKEKTDNTITIYFEVKDSGVGMTREQIEKISKLSLAQSKLADVRKYGGTGLEFTITRNIIEMMGGNILIESIPGVGSKFSFNLTFDTVAFEQKKILEDNTQAKEMKKPAFEGEVLVCEDNAMNQQVICEHLERIGLKTFVANNGKVGVDMVKKRIENKEKQFDLIFMDIYMPIMDGLEASEEIHDLVKFENITPIPIVAVTANMMSNDKEIFNMSGIIDFINKPFTSNELWSCLLKYLPEKAENAKED